MSTPLSVVEAPEEPISTQTRDTDMQDVTMESIGLDQEMKPAEGAATETTGAADTATETTAEPPKKAKPKKKKGWKGWALVLEDEEGNVIEVRDRGESPDTTARRKQEEELREEGKVEVRQTRRGARASLPRGMFLVGILALTGRVVGCEKGCDAEYCCCSWGDGESDEA